MEVSQTETAPTPYNQQVVETHFGKFRWTIENFSKLDQIILFSDSFNVDEFEWRVLIYPKGNCTSYLSIYLEVADSVDLLPGWSISVQFSLTVVNQINSSFSLTKEEYHEFDEKFNNRGFTSFMLLSELYDPASGYLINDTCIVEADVSGSGVVDDYSYTSNNEKGYVGLKNQGATCYMNSLLQTLYHIPLFRKAVYLMHTTENDFSSGSISLALLSLFYKLQYKDNSVATKELTKTFGWDKHDSFMQHDVQELNRVLCEKLDDEMKGTVVEGTIQQLFEGHHMNYIECINVNYKSTKKESFLDLQLNVKGCPDIYASFDQYVQVEQLEGDNKYQAPHFGLQDAKKGVLFIDFPPILQIQLKRFEYDSFSMMVKINQRYEFPLQLDLDRDNGKYLSPEANKNVRNLYTLYSVLVHMGWLYGGHYYAFIRPVLSDQWYKFDDELVTKEETKMALEEQYGDGEKNSNAYMLVYIRESDKEKIMCQVDENDIAEHLRVRLSKKQEEEEHKKQENAEDQPYTVVKVARNEDLAEQIGKDIFLNLVDYDKVRCFIIQKKLPFNSFKENMAQEFGIPVQFQRYWPWEKRSNKTYRPNRSISTEEEELTVGKIKEIFDEDPSGELKLFLEVEMGLDSCPLPLPENNRDDFMLFFKLYDPEKEELRFVGRLFVKAVGRPAEVLHVLNKMAGFQLNEEIELYEEIMAEPVKCKLIMKHADFIMNELQNGDIICYQKTLTVNGKDQYRYPDVPSFLKSLQAVQFRSLDKSKEDGFSLELSQLFTYDDVVERVARHLGVNDPSKIRLTSQNCNTQQPKPQPIKYRGVEYLSDMLIDFTQTSDILYYEVLDIPLPELQGLKTLKVAFLSATKDEVAVHTIRLPNNSTVGDVLDDLKSKVELSRPDSELRLLELFFQKYLKTFQLSEKIENIDDQRCTLRAEEIPEDEKNLDLQDRFIHVYHFTKDANQNEMVFGHPFLLVIHESEPVSEIKARIQKRLQVPDYEFSKWKFSFTSLSKPEYLQDSDILCSLFQRRVDYYLGLEHSDTTTKTPNQNLKTSEKPVKILK